MHSKGAKRQTLLLTAVNTIVRALGLGMRVWLSRALGAELVGVTELCASVHLLAITPLTSGLPMAVSRLTTRSQNKQAVLAAGLQLARAAALALIPALLLASPLIARLLGDLRTLPSLWMTAPCILILGYSAVYNGYCYGTEQSHLPAFSELIEQTLRFGLTALLITLLNRLTAPWLAAIPVLATMFAEIGGLIFVTLMLRIGTRRSPASDALRRPIVRLAAPTTCSRLLTTLLRSATAVLIPLRLQASGLSAVEATARLGMLNGMVTPIVLLPCVFTSALTMVALPKLAQAERHLPTLRRLLWRMLGAAVAVGLLSAAVIYAAAPLLANRLYRLPELTRLFRQACPLMLLSSPAHIVGGAMAGLGRQKQALYATVGSSAVSLGLSYALTVPMRLTGALVALTVGQAILLCWNGRSLFKATRSEKEPTAEA